MFSKCKGEQMTNLDLKFENWKNKLLDLGKRNRLINYKDTQRSSVKITYPACSELYKMFVEDESPLVFHFSKDEDNSSVTCYSIVQTNKLPSDLQKAFRNIRSKAKIANEEQGVNVLYLSFGFLRWIEADNSSQEYNSPLILVPATLTVESLNAPYVLSLHEDEIVVNPTLKYKLENDFGIVLPSFDENSSIDTFLEDVKKIVKAQNWSVESEVSLSLLSFLKINMYTDLNKHKEMMLANPVVRAISGDSNALKSISRDSVLCAADDSEEPKDVFQIVDADASQQDAIIMAKRGASFVLQGPPGTGKSQTITNIIAEKLAEGKKVLFVSEKMAALDVVHKRLSKAKLDDFCLVLHSYKANKKSVLSQLGKVLELSKNSFSIREEAFQKLNTLYDDKKKLNDYSEQVYKRIMPLNMSIYQANGIIANLRHCAEVVFSIPDVRNISKEKYDTWIRLLNKYSNIISQMESDYRNTPWKNCNITFIDHEFRHDLNSMATTLISALKKLDNELSKELNVLDLNLEHSFSNVNSLLQILNIIDDAQEIPNEWILDDSYAELSDEIKDCIDKKTRLLELNKKLKAKLALVSEKDNLIVEHCSSDISSIDDANIERQNLFSAITSTCPYSRWNGKPIKRVQELYSTAKKTAEKIALLKKELLNEYESSVFDLDYKTILGRIKTDYSSIFRVFKKTYKQDQKSILIHRRNITKKIKYSDMINLVSVLQEIDNTRCWYDINSSSLKETFGDVEISENTDFELISKQIEAYEIIKEVLSCIDEELSIYNQIGKNESAYKDHYQFLYTGIVSSDWEKINNCFNWSKSFKNSILGKDIPTKFVKKVCKAGRFINDCKYAKEAIEKLFDETKTSYRWFTEKFDDPNSFDSISFTDLLNRCFACLNGLSALEEWIDYNAARKVCISSGLKEYIVAVENNNLSVEQIIPAFQKRFFRLWLDSVLPEYPAVLGFRRRNQENTITEFQELDKEQFNIAQQRIRINLISSLPSMEHFTSGLDEVGILRRELNKQRKIMPIRRLFNAIPNLLLTLKPCLMMSPLSVSLFLEAETYKFDVVIFDEASQVCTENAIGAISRGKQVIIAGDSKQLPPTNFFRAAVSDGDYDDFDDEEYDDTDAYESILDEANILPEKTLNWHYRSKNEGLIAFSNAKIYGNRLITFPSNVETCENNGVEYVFVPSGFYDRGGRKGNIVEANKVADLVFKHFQEHPERSLGVIAFGEVQQQAIESVLRERRLRNQKYELFFDENKEDAFFVKNLENVQGDERDTIIFSIGYAKDNHGVFRMNFGPLSKAGGERRLNVAITRAKYNIKLVGSIYPTDIDVDKISTEGPKLLREYIDYAINGTSVLDNQIVESESVWFDSPFEQAVFDYIKENGYDVVTQVGCSGYRIDMAIKHPTISGIYVLGIECDGASYHSARTARERDRLRQDVLESMGWQIYRIWSTDWVKDTVNEGKRLINAIKDAITNYSCNAPFKIIDGDKNENFTCVQKKEFSPIDTDNPYGFERFEAPNLRNCSTMHGIIKEIVSKEFPLHCELLYQQLAPYYGNEKATIKVRREVDYALSRMKDQIVRKGDFLFPVGYTKITPKYPNERRIQHISIEELAEAMLIILQTCVGTTRDALSTETARVYSFTRMGQNISEAMNNAIDFLLKSNRVEEIEGKLRIKK